MDKNILPQPKIQVTDYKIIENLEVEFRNWFTIISGENGTGKSSILRCIREQTSDSSLLYNPKRNSIKKQLVQAIVGVRGGQRTKDNLLQELNQNFNDNTSHPYSSFSETIAAEYDVRRNDAPGSVPPDKIITKLKNDYGKLVNQIFPKYKAVGWEYSKGGPYFQIKKFDKHILEVDQLSTGEQEVLSLVFSVLSVIDSKEIILIDEPELHLNWALEEKLFSFLKKLANKKKKQIIVASHSRIVAEEKFKHNVIFLYFDNQGKIVNSNSIPKETRKNIIGNILKVIVSSEEEEIITVEDEFHEKVIHLLASELAISSKISVHKLNHRQGVQSLYKSILDNVSPSILDKGFFMVDGDGKSEVFSDDSRFICLCKGYNLETYFIMKTKYISELTKKSEKTIKKHILDSLNKYKLDKSNDKGIWHYAGKISPQQINETFLSKVDGKIVLSDLSSKLGYKNKDDYVKDFIVYVASDKRKLKAVFDKKLVNFFKKDTE